MLTNLKIPYSGSGEGSGKVIQNPYLGPGHHQKLISFGTCRPNHDIKSIISADYFFSNPAHRQNDRKTALIAWFCASMVSALAEIIIETYFSRWIAQL